MLTIFEKQDHAISMGVALGTGEKGYIFVINDHGVITLLGRFKATKPGVYKTHSVALTSSEDSFQVHALVFGRDVPAFNRFDARDIIGHGTDLQSIKALYEEYDPTDPKLLRVNSILVMCERSFLGSREIILKGER